MSDKNRRSILICMLIFVSLLISALSARLHPIQDQVVLIPEGEPRNLIAKARTAYATIYYPVSGSAILEKKVAVEWTDRPFFELWKEYAGVPSEIELLDYCAEAADEDTVETYGSSQVMTRKFGGTAIKAALSKNFGEYLSAAGDEVIIMASLVKTLFCNESIMDGTTLQLTIGASPLITGRFDYSRPFTAQEFEKFIVENNIYFIE